ncbi:MAG: citrate synthase [Alphaproteobacteria bacterium]|nr:citrate synthase [Alphaproteobacteria bacterium]
MAWLSSPAALARLKVKPQTLYAYVSRGLIATQPAEHDPRQRLYAQQDIDALVRRRKTGRSQAKVAARAIAWGDPVLETAIATVRDGRLLYRGRDAIALAETHALEEIAALLWDSPDTAFSSARAAPPPSGASAKARGLAYLAQRAALDPPIYGRAPAALAREGAELLCGVIDAFAPDAPPEAKAHEALAFGWRCNATAADIIRRALVLIADHELNPSTFAARVAASTGGSLAASALAGYATLTGPLHGEATARALAYLSDAQTRGANAALTRILERAERPPGCGHPLYPYGDPRAAALLAATELPHSVAEAIARAELAAGANANIDMALAAVTLALNLPADAPFTLFAAGRMAGWIAHAMEQASSGRMIRPRASYVGP